MGTGGDLSAEVFRVNMKIIQIAAIILVTLAILSWLRSDGRYDFDIRTIIPFMRGEVTLYDFGSLVLIILGLCGLSSLRRASRDRTLPPPNQDPSDLWHTPPPPSPWRYDDDEWTDRMRR